MDLMVSCQIFFFLLFLGQSLISHHLSDANRMLQIMKIFIIKFAHSINVDTAESEICFVCSLGMQTRGAESRISVTIAER